MSGWWFETTQFVAEAMAEDSGDPPQANPGRYGEEVATWLADHLRERSWDVGDVFCEDWGWVVRVQREGSTLDLNCGNEDGCTTRWSAGAVAHVGLLQRLLGRGKEPAEAVAELDAEVGQILRAEATMSWVGREQPSSEPPAFECRDPPS